MFYLFLAIPIFSPLQGLSFSSIPGLTQKRDIILSTLIYYLICKQRYHFLSLSCWETLDSTATVRATTLHRGGFLYLKNI
jgi:hypothetical protein